MGPGHTSETIQIPIYYDVLSESNETFRVTLSNPTGGNVIMSGTAYGTIIDAPVNPQYVSITADRSQILEGESVLFRIARSDSEGPLTVYFQLDASSTVAASDYTSTPAIGSVAFANGQSEATVSVTAVDDELLEAPETLALAILPYAPGTYGPAQYLITGSSTAQTQFHDGFTEHVAADWEVEWQDFNGSWQASPDGEVLWADDPHRWTPELPASIANLVTTVTWFKRPFDNPTAPWVDFAIGTGADPALGDAGIGDWDITFRAIYGVLSSFQADVKNREVTNIAHTEWKQGDVDQTFESWQGNLRVFPEADLPEGPLPAGYGPRHNRNKVKVEVTLERAPKTPVTVYLRAFDPDHPHVPIAPMIVGGKLDTLDPNDTLGDDLNRPDDNWIEWPELGIGGALAETTIQFAAGEQTRSVEFTIYAPQPGNNYRAMSSQHLEPLNTVHFWTNGVDLVFENANGQTFAVPGQYTSKILTVWRTLYVEQDSMTAPGAGDGPFDAEDPDPGDVRNAYTWLLNTLLEPANIVAVPDTLGLNLHPEVVFAHNYPTAAASVDIISKRDIPNSNDFWTVGVVGAYEGDVDKDFDPNMGDALLGESSFIRPHALIYLETIRDYHQFWATHEPVLPAANTAEVIEARTVAHEVGHLLGGFSHAAGQTDEGIMSVANNINASDSWNVFFHWQLGRIQSSPKPGTL